MGLYKVLWFKPGQKIVCLMSGDDELGGFLEIPPIHHPANPLLNAQMYWVLPIKCSNRPNHNI
jgi:hypothetical protein